MHKHFSFNYTVSVCMSVLHDNKSHRYSYNLLLDRFVDNLCNAYKRHGKSFKVIAGEDSNSVKGTYIYKKFLLITTKPEKIGKNEFIWLN